MVILFHFISCSLAVDRSKIPRETSKLSNTFDNSTCIYILLQTLPLPLLSFYVSLRTITPRNSSIFAYFNVLFDSRLLWRGCSLDFVISTLTRRPNSWSLAWQTFQNIYIYITKICFKRSPLFFDETLKR